MVILQHTVPYGVLIVNIFIFTVARKIVSKFIPESVSLLFREVIATLELCTNCAEMSVVWEVHGVIGFTLSLFILCVWWAYVWEDAEACPCGPIEDCFLCGVPLTSRTILLKIIGQAIGAYLTWSYANAFWSLHLIPTHKALNTGPCQAGLQVSMLYGAIVEAFITFISRFVALESANWTASSAAVINAITTVALCIFALDTSGGFFNPILASALTLNCDGNNLIQHVFVYWLGALSGGMIARTLYMTLRGESNNGYEKED